MARMVRHLITFKGTIYGTVTVDCDECEHRPEKLAFDSVDWDMESIEVGEVMDDEIIDAWEEHDAVILEDQPDENPGDDSVPF